MELAAGLLGQLWAKQGVKVVELQAHLQVCSFQPLQALLMRLLLPLLLLLVLRRWLHSLGLQAKGLWLVMRGTVLTRSSAPKAASRGRGLGSSSIGTAHWCSARGTCGWGSCSIGTSRWCTASRGCGLGSSSIGAAHWCNACRSLRKASWGCSRRSGAVSI